MGKNAYFHCGPSTKNQREMEKRDGKKIERHTQSTKNIFKLK